MKKGTAIVPWQGLTFLWLISLLFAGCTDSRTAQLQRVAKDWCLTIRASQVMPAYPLTEDLQPGDVFLVTDTIDQETTSYDDNGFLPLHDIITKLPMTAEIYQNTYNSNFGTPDGLPPQIWQFPKDSNGKPSTRSSYLMAPHAAFPSYTFTVQSGGSLNLAIPIHAVPVGLALINSSDADGTVQLNDAYTYGVSMDQLHTLLSNWGKSNVAWLKEIASQKKDVRNKHFDFFNLADTKADSTEPAFLRVVTRVYMVGGVNVTLTSTETNGVGASVAKSSPVDMSKLLPTTQPGAGSPGGATSPSLADTYSSISAALSQSASPGGSLALVAKEGRTVSMNEDFARPLVVGYLAYDVPIKSDGSLGAAIPLNNRMNAKLSISLNAIDAATPQK